MKLWILQVLWLTEREMVRVEKDTKRKKEVTEKSKQRLVPFDKSKGIANDHVWRVSPLEPDHKQRSVTFDCENQSKVNTASKKRINIFSKCQFFYKMNKLSNG